MSATTIDKGDGGERRADLGRARVGWVHGISLRSHPGRKGRHGGDVRRTRDLSTWAGLKRSETYPKATANGGADPDPDPIAPP